ncbi:MAG: hypothetical protein NC332_02975 [Firmicutes bacterium]|nr:hypothetical protein [Bacillota bacterium]
MKEYYLERLHWIFRYTSKNFFYCLAKTLCLIVGVPVYAVMFAVEMILTAVNMIFSWIPVLNVVVTVICKSLIFITDKTFYICILPDIKKYIEATKEEPVYEVIDVDDDVTETTVEAVSDSDDLPQDTEDDA